MSASDLHSIEASMNAARPALEAPLDGFRPGEVVVVVRVEGDDAIARRLVDLGFWSGTEVTVLRRAPLADPTVYRLSGYRLALRRNEAARVIVRRSQP